MEVRDKVRGLVGGICGTDAFGDDALLRIDLGLDSLQMVVLLVELEDAFDIRLEETDMNPFDLVRVSDVISLAEKYCHAKESGKEG